MVDKDKVRAMAELLNKGHPSAIDLVAAAEMLLDLLTEVESHEDAALWR